MRAGWAGGYFDGQTARRHAVVLELAPDGLRLRLEDGRAQLWPWATVSLVQGGHAGEQVRLERRGESGEAVVSDEVDLYDALRAYEVLPGSKFDDRRRGTLLIRIVGGAVATAGIAAALYFWGLPALAGAAASAMPLAWEERLGGAVVGELAPADQRCHDVELEAAIDLVLARLVAAAPASPYTFRLIVSDTPMVNAFALPGGHVVVMRGLLQKTTTPEELAGILAHEVQHVLRQHTTRALVSQLSTKALIAAASGGASGMGDALEAAGAFGMVRYGRSAELEADLEGLRLMRAARLDPEGMFSAFAMLDDAFMPDVLMQLSDHPAMSERIDRLRQELDAGPSLAKAEPVPLARPWTELVARCNQ